MIEVAGGSLDLVLGQKNMNVWVTKFVLIPLSVKPYFEDRQTPFLSSIDLSK